MSSERHGRRKNVSMAGVGRADEADHRSRLWSDSPTSTTSTSGAVRCDNDIKHPAEPVCRRRYAIDESVGTEQICQVDSVRVGSNVSINIILQVISQSSQSLALVLTT